jgi:hypothetical protein
MRKTLLKAVFAVLGLATSLAVATPASAAPAATCSAHLPYGYIGNYWNGSGGAGSFFGCPINDEHDVIEGHGRIQDFEHGVITWSPNQGSATMFSASWKPGNLILVHWTTPGMHYARWLMNVRVDGQDRGLDREFYNWQVGFTDSTGIKAIDMNGTGWYRLDVEGCDITDPGGSHECKQGWMNPIYIHVT